jgi:nicotinate-nucleotide pyrophosphorylase (carboxylating)
MKAQWLQTVVLRSLEDDVGTGDITAALIAEDVIADAEVITREAATVCGIPFFNAVYENIDPRVELEWQVNDGDKVAANQCLVKIGGKARSLVTGERCALNWLQLLSGTATQVSTCVDLLAGTSTQLLDTRKTVPGLRYAQKYAVKVGGGQNHRMGLYDAYLIKENHIASCGSIEQSIVRARALCPDKPIEVEVENFHELQSAIDAGADIVMLDNFDVDQMKQAVAQSQGRVKLEVSGNVGLDELGVIAETGVDYISMGALTKHVRAIDLSMRFLSSVRTASS